MQFMCFFYVLLFLNCFRNHEFVKITLVISIHTSLFLTASSSGKWNRGIFGVENPTTAGLHAVLLLQSDQSCRGSGRRQTLRPADRPVHVQVSDATKNMLVMFSSRCVTGGEAIHMTVFSEAFSSISFS